MLESLHIKNYALIDQMQMEFSPDLNVITGETGTGKSIMIKGLSLILGKRADKDAIRNKNEKIIVEGHFRLNEKELKPLFDHLDLDFDKHTIIRREITPSGKSRAFVNDTPVRLDDLEKIGEKIIDIHSQHQQILLQRKDFQFDFIDSLSNNLDLRNRYAGLLYEFRENRKELEKWKMHKQQLLANEDYRRFQLNELASLNWDLDLDKAELQLKNFQNQEEILIKLNEAIQLLDDDNFGIIERFRQVKNTMENLSGFDKRLEELHTRTENLFPELGELSYDIHQLFEEFQLMDTSEKEKLEREINRFFELMQKHRVNTKEELKALYDKWQSEQSDLSLVDEKIKFLHHKTDELQNQLKKLSRQLHEKRLKSIPEIENLMHKFMADLGMENSRIKIHLTPGDTFDRFGTDELQILLSPDKGKTFGQINKIASGGEISRIMLIIKYLISQKKHLPAIIFDEIDAGVSGEIARKMARLIEKMSGHMQVIVITHLPQMAVKGSRHFKVLKEEINGQIVSGIKELRKNERIHEIAEMLEGKPPSASALEHAAHLLGVKSK